VLSDQVELQSEKLQEVEEQLQEATKRLDGADTRLREVRALTKQPYSCSFRGSIVDPQCRIRRCCFSLFADLRSVWPPVSNV